MMHLAIACVIAYLVLVVLPNTPSAILYLLFGGNLTWDEFERRGDWFGTERRKEERKQQAERDKLRKLIRPCARSKVK
jgi:hypothetical protein